MVNIPMFEKSFWSEIDRPFESDFIWTSAEVWYTGSVLMIL